MRRPTFCSEFAEDDDPISTPPEPSDKESRLSKMKRILTTTILLGRKGKKESVHSLSTKTPAEFGENESDYYEKDGAEKDSVEVENSNVKIEGGSLDKCKITKGIQAKSSKGRSDENMETENVSMQKKELSLCLTKKAKEVVEPPLPSEVTAEIVLKPRKRKERLDSEGSIKQENKVIRSNSEERPESRNKGEAVGREGNVRRVSSQEDFSRVRVLQEINPSQEKAKGRGLQRSASRMEETLHDHEEEEEEEEELECERIRSWERFSRAVAPPRGRRNYPRKRIKGSKKKMDSGEAAESMKAEPPKGEGAAPALTGATTGIASPVAAERDSSPSSKESSSPPNWDFTSLYKQVGGSEPVTSWGKVGPLEEEPESPSSIEVLISPRNSLVMHLLNSDPSVPPSPPREHNIRNQGAYDSQERKLTKQINSIKRKLKRYEEGFQEEFGYRPSQADKMANKDIKKLCSDLNKLRSQLKQFKDDSFGCGGMPGTKPLSFLTCLEGSVPFNQNGTSGISKHGKSSKTVGELLQDVEKRLQEKRQQSGRSSEISEMNRGDLLEEKLAVQKALLYLENVFGRPDTKEDRDLVRPLYQRYRSLKRLVVRNSGTKLNNSTGELATILEHEAMEFTNSTSTSFELGEGTLSAPEGLNIPSVAAEVAAARGGGEGGSPLPKPQKSDELHNNSSSSSDSLGENLHSLPLCQLLEQQKAAREEKKNLRRSLKEFEESFQSVTGRRAQRQDRIMVEAIYANYKQVKAKLRLLDALVAKKSCVKRNSC